MLTVEQISKSFFDNKNNEIKALDSVSFQVTPGHIFGLLGPNGAGKTTLLRIMATIMQATEGQVEVNGYRVDTQPEEVRRSIGFLSGNTRLYKKLTPVETMRFFGSFYDIPSKELESRIDSIVRELDMEDFQHRRVEKLSTGQVQKTSMARCMIHQPAVYILDEPTMGLDILTSRTIISFIQEKKAEGRTILFSTHYMEEAESLCDSVGLLHKGQLVESGTLSSLKHTYGLDHIRDIFLAQVDRKEVGYVSV